MLENIAALLLVLFVCAALVAVAVQVAEWVLLFLDRRLDRPGRRPPSGW